MPGPRLDTHPAARITGAPLLHDGRLFVPVSSLEEYTAMTPTYECCRFRGSLVALDARTGQQRWQTYTVDEAAARGTTTAGTARWGPSGVAIWSAPTFDVERGVLYVATGDSYTEPAAATSDAVLAIAAGDGRVLWVKQVTEGDAYNMACNGNGPNCPEADGPDFDFGASPMLVSLGGDRRALVVGQKSGIVWALDPDRQGAVLWQARVGAGGMLGGVEWGTATDGTLAYAAVSDVVVRPAAGQGRRTEMDPGKGGGLVGLRVADGTRAWSAPPPVCGDRRPCSPAQSAAVTAIPGVVFSGALDGVMRAYSTTDGAVVWSVDTVRPFDTVNGVTATGGSIDAAGPVVVGGTLLFASGYGSWGGAPGNVLLAFSVDAR